jgi:hypothetical protein
MESGKDATAVMLDGVNALARPGFKFILRPRDKKPLPGKTKGFAARRFFRNHEKTSISFIVTAPGISS